MPHYKNVSTVTGASTLNNTQNFDDPTVSYDEICLYYNGGWDLTCLVSLVPKHYGGSPPKHKVYPQVEMINLFFKTCIDYVNDKQYKDEEYCEIKRYEFVKDKSPVTVKTTSMNVKRRLFKITSDEFNVNTISRFLDKDNNPTSVVSSSLTKLKSYVSSSLHFNKPQKIKVNSTIINNNNSGPKKDPSKE